MCKITKSLKLTSNCNAGRGVTGLGGARGKKQVWRPLFELEAFWEANVLLKKVLVTLLGLFGAPIAIWRPGNCAPLAPLVTPLFVQDASAYSTPRRCAVHFADC